MEGRIRGKLGGLSEGRGVEKCIIIRFFGKTHIFIFILKKLLMVITDKNLNFMLFKSRTVTLCKMFKRNIT